MISNSAYALGTAAVADGRIRLRSNVVDRDDAWDLVPGEVLADRRPDLMRKPNRPTQLQVSERMYYVPCGVCGRTINLIMREGCRQCPHGPTPRQLAEAQEQHRLGLEAVQAARLRLGLDGEGEPNPGSDVRSRTETTGDHPTEAVRS